jgi:hypothetical protein
MAIYKMRAPFKHGMAGKLRVKDGVCATDDERLMRELTSSPHNFTLEKTIDELAQAEGKKEDGKLKD